jgi:hypothetical protein
VWSRRLSSPPLLDRHTLAIIEGDNGIDVATSPATT